MHDEFFFDIILDKLARAVTWRRSIAVRHPADPRNGKAIAELSRLAKSRFADVPPDTWSAIAPLLESDDFNECANQHVRDIGFRRHPRDIAEFIGSLGESAKVFAFAGGAA
jgi:hypothetical protein